MPIQGKKRKSRSGRRPAGAPRVPAQPQRGPWYAQRSAQLIGAGVLIVLALAAFLVVKNARDSSSQLARKQREIDDFTGSVQVLLQKVSPPASEMLIATADDKNLAADAKRWDKLFRDAQAELTEATATTAPEVDTANRLIFQSVLQYTAAAQTYALIPEARGKLPAKILERASAQVAAADGTWESGIALLDEVRTELELDPTQFRAPSEVTAPGGGATPLPGG